MAPATGGGRREMKVTGRELRYKRVRGALAGRIKSKETSKVKSEHNEDVEEAKKKKKRRRDGSDGGESGV